MRRRTPTLRLASLVALLLALAAGSAHAADIEWSNDAGGSWNDPANWSPAQVPTFEDRALVTLAGSYTIEVSSIDVLSAAELVLGGPGSTPTLSLAPGGSLSIEGPFALRAGALLVLGAESVFSVLGAAAIAGRLEADQATFGADGIHNSGEIDIIAMSLSGRVVNKGLIHAEGMCDFGTVENGSGAVFEARTGPGLLPGAFMDSLVNQGHVSFGPSIQAVAGSAMVNEPGGVIEIEASTMANSETFRNAGVWRTVPSGQLIGVNFEQLASGEFSPRYAAGGVAFSITCTNVALDGTLAPVFAAAFTPPPGNLPLIFTENLAGQFAIVSQAGTHGVAVDAVYPDNVFVRVLGAGIAITPPAGSDEGSVSTLISGCDLTSVTAARLVRAGQSDIVAEPLSRDADSGTIYATFELTGRAHGLWDLVIEGPGGSQTASGVFAIEPVFTVTQSIRVDLIGRRLLRFGRTSEWSLAIHNPNGTDAVGAVQLDIPGGLGWEIIGQRPAKAGDRGAAGKFAEATSVIVPGVIAPPGISMSGVRIRLSLPADAPLGQSTLKARWYAP